MIIAKTRQVDMPKPNGGYPLALDAPVEPVIIIDRSQIGRAVQASRESPRGRIILPFHKTAADACHRMLNALQPGSYIRPHRHLSLQTTPSTVGFLP